MSSNCRPARTCRTSFRSPDPRQDPGLAESPRAEPGSDYDAPGAQTARQGGYAFRRLKGTSSARGELAVISSARSRGVPLRRLLLASAVAVIPVLAGCEAGTQAPTLNFHVPTDASTASAGDLL